MNDGGPFLEPSEPLGFGNKRVVKIQSGTHMDVVCMKYTSLDAQLL
jgi:hypothetical protein